MFSIRKFFFLSNIEKIYEEKESKIRKILREILSGSLSQQFFQPNLAQSQNKNKQRNLRNYIKSLEICQKGSDSCYSKISLVSIELAICQGLEGKF